jgi:hypothetical protein
VIVSAVRGGGGDGGGGEDGGCRDVDPPPPPQPETSMAQKTVTISGEADRSLFTS